MSQINEGAFFRLCQAAETTAETIHDALDAASVYAGKAEAALHRRDARALSVFLLKTSKLVEFATSVRDARAGECIGFVDRAYWEELAERIAKNRADVAAALALAADALEMIEGAT